MIYRILNITELNIEEISKYVSSKRLEKAKKFKNEADKKRSIAVEYLLNEMLKENTSFALPVSLSYDDKGKPHLYEDISEENEKSRKDLIHFSLSHSGDYVACIISDKPCGIDIEKHNEKRDYEKISKRVCTENELTFISDADDFYSIWTLKESVMKAVGLGLALDMRNIDFSLHEIVIDDKVCKINGEQGTVDRRYYTNVNGEEFIGYVLNAPEGYSASYVEKIIK